MIDLTHKNEWQYLDEATGLIFPWFTKSFLDELVTWDLKDKVVFEYGLGASTIWWAKKCKRIEGVENNFNWWLSVCEKLRELKLFNCMMYSHKYKQEFIASVYSDWDYDIVVIDGEPIEWRDDCIKPALDCLKPNGILIIDNWLQRSTDWIATPENQQLLTQYEHKIYKQEGHDDWQTLLVYKP